MGDVPLQYKYMFHSERLPAFCLVNGNGTIFRILRWNITSGEAIIQVMFTLGQLHIAIEAVAHFVRFFTY